jgi:hypothetical protein
MDDFDGTPTAGRKGIPYDWRAVLTEHEQTVEFADLAGWVTDAALAEVSAGVLA